MAEFPRIGFGSSRRWFLQGTGAAGAMAWAAPALAKMVNLGLPGGPSERELTTAFPLKGEMILQRTRPPLLETPFSVFDRGVFTPNDQFFVRWHWAGIPGDVDVKTFRLNVRGHVNKALSLTLADVLSLPRVEMAAVNQCSGNSRGLFEPRVPGGQWLNGAMGNAKWVGVRLRDVLDRAGVKSDAVAVRFKGLEEPIMPDAPHFLKSLAIDHARDGEVMLAYQMNGQQLPLLNGFPMRLVVPGWFSTYWVKMLTDIEVLNAPDDNYWMAKAYLIPDTAGANVKPGETGFKLIPINTMLPRSFFTNVTNESTVKPGSPVALRGLALGGDCGVSAVDISMNAGATWTATTLGRDEGTYSFRRWTAEVVAPTSGALDVMVRCTNTRKIMQPGTPNWNGGGFMRNVIEQVKLKVA